MTLLLHTDIGHDPDDIIALSYLIGRGDYVPSIVSINPGFREQALIVDSIYREFGLNRPTIYTSSYPTKIYKRTSKLEQILSYGRDDSFELSPNEPIECSTALVIGPPKGLRVKCHRMIFQGGYSPNSTSPLEKFKGRSAVQSFNPSGAKADFVNLRDSNLITKKYYVGKNVCHGFKKKNVQKKLHNFFPKRIAAYFDQLSEDKAMHDLLAAMMMIYPDRGVWEQAMPVFDGLLMSTTPTDKQIYSLIGLQDVQ